MKMDAAILSIIIVSYNTAELTKKCIQSICDASNNNIHLFEIIVIDNNSADESIKYIKLLQKQYKNIKLIELESNIGFGAANNVGIENAHGKYILLLNSDTFVHDHAIEQLLDFYQKNEDRIHFLGGKLLNTNGSAQPSAAPFYSLPIIFAALFLKGDYWGLTRSSPSQAKQVDWVSGACILTKKSIYQAVGGFAKDIFMYMEEVDLLYRARKAGYTTWFYPAAQFTHHGSASSQGKTYPILQVYQGFIYFYKKHYSSWERFLLKNMLQLKAVISLIIGKLTNNRYLIETYGKAFKIASMD